MINGKSLTFAFILTLIAFIPLNAAENFPPKKSPEEIKILIGETIVDRFEQMFQSGDFDFKAYGNRGVTVLHYAVLMNDQERVKLLIEQGADVNVADHLMQTPLQFATDNNYFEMTKFLVEHGADVNAKNNNGGSVLFNAAATGNLELVEYLVNQERCIIENSGVLHGAVKSGNLEMVKWLIEHGADVSDFYLNDTVLGWTINNTNPDILHYFVEQVGVDVNASINRKIHYTALECAVKHNNFESVKFLVEHGAKINPRYISGTFPTPGWYYFHNADPEIVEYLRERDTVLKGLSIAVSLIVLAALMAFIYFVYRMVRPKKHADTELSSS